MSADLQFDFLVDKQANTITVRREFAAKRQLVWDCYTKSELLDRWFAPKPLTTRTRFMDFREGGYWHYAMIMPDGTEYWSRQDYASIQPIEHYTARDGFTDETGEVNPTLPQSDQDLTFKDLGDHTLVQTIVTYPSLSDLEKVIEMGMQEGLTSTLERLDELLPTLS
ncbi:MAG: SRPBCC domain-containing protein [Acidiferrobacteraceae bacterium]|jgi:uncharacterized protein YndB with AHSA1/START domain